MVVNPIGQNHKDSGIGSGTCMSSAFESCLSHLKPVYEIPVR